METFTLSIFDPCNDHIRKDLLESSKSGNPSKVLSLHEADVQDALDILHEVSRLQYLGKVHDSNDTQLQVLVGCCLGKYSLDMIACNELRRLVLKLSMAADIFPMSLFVHGITCLNKDKYSDAGFADVYCGTLGEKAVALKHLRPFKMRDIVKLKKVIIFIFRCLLN